MLLVFVEPVSGEVDLSTDATRGYLFVRLCARWSEQQVTCDLNVRTTQRRHGATSDTRSTPIPPTAPIWKNMFPEVIRCCFVEAWWQIALASASFITVSADTPACKTCTRCERAHERKAAALISNQLIWRPALLLVSQGSKVTVGLRWARVGSKFVGKVCAHVSVRVLCYCHFPFEMPELKLLYWKIKNTSACTFTLPDLRQTHFITTS